MEFRTNLAVFKGLLGCLMVYVLTHTEEDNLSEYIFVHQELARQRKILISFPYFPQLIKASKIIGRNCSKWRIIPLFVVLPIEREKKWKLITHNYIFVVGVAPRQWTPTFTYPSICIWHTYTHAHIHTHTYTNTHTHTVISPKHRNIRQFVLYGWCAH